MKNDTLSRRDREKLRQRQDMLAASLKLFSEKGYHNVSMQEIAVQAEFALGTLYKFFKNKEDLYKTLIKEQADKFHESLIKSMNETVDEIGKLRNYVRTKGIIFMDNISIIRLYFAETKGASFNIKAGLSNEIRKDYEVIIQQLAQIFEVGMQKKRFQQIADPYHLALSLDSLSNTFLYLWLEAPEKHPYPNDPDVILNILFKGLVVKS